MSCIPHSTNLCHYDILQPFHIPYSISSFLCHLLISVFHIQSFCHLLIFVFHIQSPLSLAHFHIPCSMFQLHVSLLHFYLYYFTIHSLLLAFPFQLEQPIIWSLVTLWVIFLHSPYYPICCITLSLVVSKSLWLIVSSSAHNVTFCSLSFPVIFPLDNAIPLCLPREKTPKKANINEEKHLKKQK